MKDFRYYFAKRLVLKNRITNFWESLDSSLNRKGSSLEGNLHTYHENSKLVMTMVCRDEIDLIEQNIRFHLAMGVDGIIVTDHRSIDGTRELLMELKERGLVLEVIHKDCKAHLHSAFVLEMIDIARRKYNADWIINADADEFYFARSLNLKNEILKSALKANVLKVYSKFFFPDGREDFLNCPYFCERGLTDQEYSTFGVKKNFMTDYWEIGGCPKSIHSTRDFISISDGNHAVTMNNYLEIEPLNISLYHYHIRNYKSLEKKAIKAMSTISELNKVDMSRGWKMTADLYRKGELQQYYDIVFGKDMFEVLTKAGCLREDSSVFDFMKMNGIVK